MPNLGPLELGNHPGDCDHDLWCGAAARSGRCGRQDHREFRRNMGSSDNKKEADLLEDDEDNFEDDVDGEVAREEKPVPPPPDARPVRIRVSS